jgi:BlaI family transcriptional regulator, penicillinase repressor
MKSTRSQPQPLQPPKPTDAELDILHVLWQRGPSTVRFVNDELNKQQPLRQGKKEDSEIGYTTTLKIMQIMTEKTLVRRDESSRTHVYRAAVDESDVQQTLVDKFVSSVFRGSAMKLVMQALGSSQTSDQELMELRRLLDEKTQERAESQMERRSQQPTEQFTEQASDLRNTSRKKG